MALRLGECLLRNHRESKGLSQKALSQKLLDDHGVSVSDTMISLYERGEKYMKPLVSRAVCLTLGISESELYEFIRT